MSRRSRRVFESSRCWQVKEGRKDVEFYLLEGEVIITIDDGVHGEIDGITITAKEATLLKEFLIRNGY